jgi:hypothetical protein
MIRRRDLPLASIDAASDRSFGIPLVTRATTGLDGGADKLSGRNARRLVTGALQSGARL